VDLPTYTSIWRIEKRLYKLYDFRLPMPLPIGQVAVFAAIAVPYVVLLTLLGLPFNHTLIWLYVLPPGLATWLVTRPVLESKRLPELIKSQLRYLAEPRVLCRMAPLAEADIVLMTARVWRPRVSRRRAGDLAEAPNPAMARKYQVSAAPAAAPGVEVAAASAAVSAAERDPGIPAVPVTAYGGIRRGPLPPGRSRDSQSSGRPRAGEQVKRAEFRLVASGSAAAASPPVPPLAETPAQPARSEPKEQQSEPTRPVVTVVGGADKTTPPTVERALAGPSARRGDLRAGRVSVVPGGHRPGKPDLLHRDRARAQLPIGIKPRIVVLGCTVGAGQTMTTLITGEVLASLRSDQVAVMDLNPGPGSLARRAQARPAPSQAALTGRSRLVVIGPRGEGSGPAGPGGTAGPAGPNGTAGNPEARGHPRDAAIDAITFEAATDRYDLVIADPATVAVPKLLAVADQLILVAPASGAAPGAIAMTFEWLEAHGQSGLAANSIMALNGVSRRSMSSIDQAERVCAGKCRAVVKIPWDDQLQGQVVRRALPAGPSAQLRQHWTGVLSPATAVAYTALAGVLVARLSGDGVSQEREGAHEPAHAGQAPR
jgi:MinD-like ATPase involved in chromosome partitioning or flagellar assembly